MNGLDTATQTTLLDMNDLMGQSLDDTEDVPEFINDVPAGNYLLNLTTVKVEKYKSKDKETQQEEEKLRIRIVYSVTKTVDLADPSDLPVPDGSLFSETFMINENGKKYFKRQAKNVLGAENIEGVPMKDIFAAMSDDVTVRAKVKTKESAGDGGKVYLNVQVHILGKVDDPQFAK